MTNYELKTLLAIDRSKLPPDGRPLYNRLIFSHSPYLLQHARNPVDWRQWSEEARQEARQRNLPLFVSIGYATCHWCHVMAHESFEDPEVSDILNHAFVPVKVDREERPDLDAFCMAACQAMTGSGGWPLNCLLTPDGTPFYAFTYLPKESRNGLPGFLELLDNLATIWQYRPEAVERNATAVVAALQRRPGISPSDYRVPLGQIATQADNTLRRIYDQQYGGFGTAPKFPLPCHLRYLLHRNDPTLQEMALHTLRAMRQGGIWDQLAGGIHRYSTDQHWLVPHFEKMLYDQALVATIALDAYQLSADSGYYSLAKNLLEFTLQELTSPEGGFYCGLDADSEGREGACYVWRIDEITAVLGTEAKLFCKRYGVTPEGNSETGGENVLHLAQTTEALAREHNCSEEELTERLARSARTLLAVRTQREQPLKDIKIITAWNGLMIAALARGASLSGNQRWLDAAQRAANFISTRLVDANRRLLRCYLLRPAPITGFLEDYACLAWGYRELYQATQRREDLEQAQRLCQVALELFRRPDGLLTTAGHDAEQMPLPLADLHDGVIPSAPSLMMDNLVTLTQLTNETRWQEEALRLLHCYQRHLHQAPINSLWFLHAALNLESKRHHFG